MSRLLIFVYGILSYAIGMGGLVWFILFISPWAFLPRHINTDSPGPVGVAIAVNLGLMLLFGLQHSVMARPTFKQRWTQFVPKAAERSTYVLLSGILMALFCLYWQPLPGLLWQVDNTVGQALLIAGFVAGWVIAVIATFLINHFELFGLQQIYLNLVDKPAPQPHFTDRFLYKVVRHPLQLGILIGIWSLPTMSATQLMLSATMTIYIFIGLYYEERNLVDALGEDYKNYQQRVRMIVPLRK